MRVSEIMTREIRTVSAGATLQTAAEVMRKGDVGMLPVTDGEELVGVVTDRDIAVRAVADGLNPKRTVVDSIMTPDVVFCFADQAIDEAAYVMEQEGLRRLLVYNREGDPVGVLSLSDIAISAAQPISCNILEEVSKLKQFEDRVEYPDA